MRTPTVRKLGFPLTLLGLAALVFGGLFLLMRSMERRAIESPAVRDQMIGNRARPLAEVARTIARMQLVTAEVQTSVSTTVSHENWRGMAAATVETPVHLLYGVDVSAMDVQNVGFSPATESYIVRIPPPRRIATEVCGGDETVDVQVGWARLRSRAGEYYLGQARKSLYDRARELILSREDALKVRKTTQMQVAETVRRIVGPGTEVTVVFDDSAPEVKTAGSGEEVAGREGGEVP